MPAENVERESCDEFGVPAFLVPSCVYLLATMIDELGQMSHKLAV
jgi:hypothetical protein